MAIAYLHPGVIMIRLAIPYFGSRVAPRLDGARRLLLLSIEDGKVTSRESVETSSRTSAGKLRLMKRREVGVVICGGIDQQSLRLFRSSGMRIFSWITGEVDDAVRMFLRGDLKPGTMLDLRAGRHASRQGADEGTGRPAPPHSI
jgi:predicted Fe-Mo cluster-binding NifX family protein